MSKLDQVLKIEPAGELLFKGPFTEVVTADLNLTNPSDKRVCFKVKTTAPKRYCVRPNSGVLEPKQAVTVAVMLQPFEYDPNEKNKHKFMVQTMFAPDGKIDNQDQLWKDASPDKLMDSKLRCVLDPTGNSAVNSSPPAVEEKVKVVKHEKQEADLPGPRSDPTTTSVKSTVNQAVEGARKQDEEIRKLQEKINMLQAENSNMKSDAARLRKVAMADTVSSTPPQSQRVDVQSSSPLSVLPPKVYLILALIIGLIIGKLFL